MNPYTAIMLAADHIEANPNLFDFEAVEIPDCGTPGCALGWIAHFAGITTDICDTSADFLGVADGHKWRSEGAFYRRMRALASHNWINDSALCVKGLRLYAEKYHGDERIAHTGIPESVLDIFKAKVTA